MRASLLPRHDVARLSMAVPRGAPNFTYHKVLGSFIGAHRHQSARAWTPITDPAPHCPKAGRSPSAGPQMMPATATRLVKSIWQGYFDVKDKAEAAPADVTAAGSHATASNASSVKSAATPTREAAAAGANAATEAEWWGGSTGTVDGRAMYAAARVGPLTKLKLGDVVSIERGPRGGRDVQSGAQELRTAKATCPPGAGNAAGAASASLGLLQCMWQDSSGAKRAQVRVLLHGADTLLGDAASPDELFVTEHTADVALGEVVKVVEASRLVRQRNPSERMKEFEEDQQWRADNAARGCLRYRYLYRPNHGMFCALPDDLALGSYLADAEPPVALAALPDGSGFIKDGVEYEVGCHVLVEPATFPVAASAKDEAQKLRDAVPSYARGKGGHKGSTAGVRAWGVARLRDVRADGDGAHVKVLLQRFWRPEDVSSDLAYKAGPWDVYEPTDGAEEEYSAGVVVGRCEVTAPSGPSGGPFPTFKVVGTYDDVIGRLTLAEDSGGVASDQGSGNDTAVEAKQACGVTERLASMDIFAGCGGLSEGLHQAGVAEAKWAVEFDKPAADAFKLNYPRATVLDVNCNAVLLAAMKKAGLEADCEAHDTPEALEAALSEEQRQTLPQPGEVDMIMGGPPCQGYSGMNRFNKRENSMVQNSMVVACLSFVDFYRPRYALVENVRAFVTHNGGRTFRLALRTLLDMGYQVRFGVLNAGHYGVPQSRTRMFIWAAAPGEKLPDWPTPTHAFRSPPLTINLPGGVRYATAPDHPGAPLRTTTVRDAIGDLPPVDNGDSGLEREYGTDPVTEFQRAMRKGAPQLRDHVSKVMNDVNLERCRAVPKGQPGADWRALKEVVEGEPHREMVRDSEPLVPRCLVSTAHRHNGWRGLYGRLDPLGHFPTLTTDPQPMGKVGQVFHPEQDRIVTVRECARAQGFPDTHQFAGEVKNKYTQVGNAVPPPLAKALGRELRRALEAKHSPDTAATDALR